jgi:hypothetical protein
VKARSLKWLVIVGLMIAAFATAGCQPSISDQLQAGLPQAAPRPTVMPNEVGQDAETVASSLMDSGVKVRINVPERSVPASGTPKGGQVLAVYVKPVTVDMTQADRRFTGFKIISQDPPAGGTLAADETVLLTVGAHPRAIAGATWYSTHMDDDKKLGDGSCLNSGGAGETGCHTDSYCVSCHSKAIKAPKLGKP